MDGLSVAEKIKAINNRIASACAKSRHQQKGVTLVAVSKFQPSQKIRQAILAKQFLFAENYSQEAQLKQAELKAEAIEWHFIGNIQQNKIKNMVGNFSLIQSVDKFEQIEKIGKIAVEKSIGQKILLEVNIGCEDSKSGMPLSHATDVYRKALDVPNVIVCGLMCMPPLDRTEQMLRKDFGEMKSVFEEIKSCIATESFKILSMGTSADFEVAIEEGSTMVRIGTEIFGSRESK
ncbi:MAG: YggS family pyridoxal phosphate-dependent enzyme [Pseudomonadota bacterium]|mgnify:CR=1 FL=1|nr:YggS family pyridoxal phosphate-dependent enzyme [Pseudomonadota bacterium]